MPPKVSMFFPGVKIHEADADDAFLRVSCYLRREEEPLGPERAGDDAVGRHVRFSIWDGERPQAKCVLSIPEPEARELASFLLSELDDDRRVRRGSLGSLLTGDLRHLSPN
jgi:hypothetical protein